MTQPAVPALPFAATVAVRGSGTDVFPLGRHRDLRAAQQRCQGDFRTMTTLTWRSGKAGTWIAHAGTNVVYTITRR